jgi:hypothetical protein
MPSETLTLGTLPFIVMSADGAHTTADNCQFPLIKILWPATSPLLSFKELAALL